MDRCNQIKAYVIYIADVISLKGTVFYFDFKEMIHKKYSNNIRRVSVSVLGHLSVVGHFIVHRFIQQ